MSRAADYKTRLALTVAAVALFTAIGSLAEAAGMKTLWIGSAIIFILGSLTVLWFTVRAELHSLREARRSTLERLVTTKPGREHVPILSDLTPYDLGADEVGDGSEEAADYLPRDVDDDIRRALAEASMAEKPRMVVVSGPSKSGKSRTLYEAARTDEGLESAAVLAPHNIRDLAAILDDGLPEPPWGRVILWLDGLERFVSAGEDGMDGVELEKLAKWEVPVVVLATVGATKDAGLMDDGLADPVRQLCRHRRVTVVPLSNQLSETEQAEAGRRYGSKPEVAEQIIAHGIGGYLVAAPELARKLREGRHTPTDSQCPEGAAVVWAAIDWARSGMNGAIPKSKLRDLWPHYLEDQQPTEEGFRTGLSWALRPVYRTVALLYETSSYEASGWIVAHADQRISRAINASARDRMIEHVAPGDAFDMGVAAYRNDARDDAQRAFERALESDEAPIASNAAFNLGLLRAEAGDLEGARRAYGRAMQGEAAEPAAMAAVNLGVLLEDRGDEQLATSAFERAVQCGVPGHSEAAAIKLGALREQQGDIHAAEEAYERATQADDPAVAAKAWFMLGSFRREHQLPGAAPALERVSGLGQSELEAAANHQLGGILESSDPEGARVAYERVVASGHESLVPLAATRLAALAGSGPRHSAPVDAHGGAALRDSFAAALALDKQGDFAGARRAYETVMDAGDADLSPAAAIGLGGLLGERGDPAGAQAAYRRAIDSRHPRIVPAANYALGCLHARLGDADAARGPLEQAAASGDDDIATAAQAALETLP